MEKETQHREEVIVGWVSEARNRVRTNERTNERRAHSRHGGEKRLNKRLKQRLKKMPADAHFREMLHACRRALGVLGAKKADDVVRR